MLQAKEVKDIQEALNKTTETTQYKGIPAITSINTQLRNPGSSFIIAQTHDSQLDVEHEPEEVFLDVALGKDSQVARSLTKDIKLAL